MSSGYTVIFLLCLYIYCGICDDMFYFLASSNCMCADFVTTTVGGENICNGIQPPQIFPNIFIMQ